MLGFYRRGLYMPDVSMPDVRSPELWNMCGNFRFIVVRAMITQATGAVVLAAMCDIFLHFAFQLLFFLALLIGFVLFLFVFLDRFVFFFLVVFRPTLIMYGLIVTLMCLMQCRLWGDLGIRTAVPLGTR